MVGGGVAASRGVGGALGDGAEVGERPSERERERGSLWRERE